MKNKLNYKIADQSVEIHTDYLGNIDRLLPGFVHFNDSSDDKEPLIQLFREFESDESELFSADDESKVIHTFDLEEDFCKFRKKGGKYYFSITTRGGDASMEFAMEIGSPKVSCRLIPDSENGRVNLPNPFHLKFSLWMVLGFTGIPRKFSALHSSVIIYNNSAVLFLGESGTGKSTHTKLWLQHIAGSKLLNDDSPILSVDGEKASVHGSPWSGKGQKYVNERYPVRAVVRIKQHSSNELQKLNTLESFGALYPSFPPAFLKDNYFEGHICEIISKVISTTPVYNLHCLPNREAAFLVKEAFYK
ncbi:MAG: hypothetical protein CVU12_09055 [Bacteroidetes bacterium HGW-Bacteroidetes-7]|jgi:hypothetical protein|nr:MAG: hypothetical protein CVU12_09055 [Bacteroidetes bacterium HGW-Bacteroidetes-7]